MERREFVRSVTAICVGGMLSIPAARSAKAAASIDAPAEPGSKRFEGRQVGRFTLDLRWTARGLAHLPSGETRAFRDDAVNLAAAHNLVFFSPKIIERLTPMPVGPIWFVEGKEADVRTVVARFNEWGNVTAQYFDYKEIFQL